MEENKQQQPVKKAKGNGDKILTIVGILLCVILIPIIVVNMTLIVKSIAHPDEVPDFCGYIPMVVLSDSMNPEFATGDLLIHEKTAAEDVQKDDIIAFFDPASTEQTILSHRVVKIKKSKDGKLSFTTKGDANKSNDSEAVSADQLIGKHKKTFKGLGNVALFLQSIPGLIICVVIPLLIFLGLEYYFSHRQKKKNEQETEALKAELAALKQEKANRDKGQGTRDEVPETEDQNETE